MKFKNFPKIKYILIGILGLIVVFVGLIVYFTSPWEPGRPVTPEAETMADMAQIQGIAEQIYLQNKTYSDLSCGYDERMTTLCNNIEKRVGMRPIIHTFQDKYCAYVKLNINEYYCMDSTGSRLKTTTNPSDLGYCDGITFVCPTGK